nr:hypothetical protein [Tanacetum cinerariifolium]
MSQVPESDFKAHPEDDDDKDPEEDPVDYPADGGDDGDDEEESSEDDEMDVEADEEEEEEHPAPTSCCIFPTCITIIPLVFTTATDSFSTATPILSPPSPILSPAPPPSPIRSLGYRAAMIRLRDEAASTSHSPPLQLPSARRKEDRPEVTLPPRKWLDIALGPRYEGALVSTDTELGGYVREFETRVRQDMDEIYTRLDDEQTERQLLAGRLNMLFRDRRAHAYTCQLMEAEARMSREAWITALQGQVTALQAQVTTLQGQQGLAEDPIQPELPKEAGGSA